LVKKRVVVALRIFYITNRSIGPVVTPMKMGIIGGTGIYDLEGTQELCVDTEYGEISLTHQKKGERDIFFVPRHGSNHTTPPHRVNYRGNITALANCHVDYIIALCTVGSMQCSIPPGTFFVPVDFIDFTRRNTTFYHTEVVHIDMTLPFCPSLQKTFLQTLDKHKTPYSTGVYIATEGPRLETKAEIAMLSQFGDVVGMTLVPEVILAREKGLCYGALCLVSNMCAGLQNSLPATEIKGIYDEKKSMVHDIVFTIMDNLRPKKTCRCEKALQTSRL
jgi:5'-methylthioadenosine phosphorylase